MLIFSYLQSKRIQMQEKQKRPIDCLIQSIRNHLQYLNKFSDDVIKKFLQFDYPIKPLIKFYQKQFLEKLNTRANKSYIFSDILIWYGHRLVGLSFSINQYIQGLDEKERKANITTASSNKISKSNTLQLISHNVSQKSSTYTSLGDIVQDGNESNGQSTNTLQHFLRIPQSFIRNNIIQSVNQALKYCELKQYKNQQISLELFKTVFDDSLKNLIHQENSVQQIQQKVMNAFYKKNANSSKQIVKMCYRFLFIAKLKLRVKKANKRINERKKRIQELIGGEKNYTERMKDYIDFIKNPIQATNLITKQQQIILFSEVQSIVALHNHFYSELTTRYANYSKGQTYGDILGKNFPYFKIYTNYILHADEAQQLMRTLMSKHAQIGEICRKFLQDKQKVASDQLKQPTFRIAKYELIIKQLLKNTNPSHPDFKKLEQAQVKGITMLRSINENVDKISKRNKLNKYEQQYGTQSRPIFAQKRQLLEQFQMFFIYEDKQLPVTVIVFNDVLVVINNEARKIIRWIQIDEYFYVRPEQDNKTYKNVIKIHSDGFITFSAGSQEKHSKKAEEFLLLLQRVSKQNEQSNAIVYVQVIGTEEIGSTSFAKHTQYVIEIKYLSLRKYVHLRFSEMQPFVAKIQQHYHDHLNISNEETLKKNWFNNHKSKIIQDRKRTIEQILQKLLNNEMIKKDPDFILQQLKIDKNFFRKAEEYKKKRTAAAIEKLKQDSKQLNKIEINLYQSYKGSSILRQRKRQSRQPETILCATQIKLGRDLFHDTDEFNFDTKKTDSEKINIEVCTMDKQQPITVAITEHHTVQDVCYKVSKLIGLRMNRDFRLFHEIGKKELRVLDQEQKIMKIFSFPRIELQIGFVSSIKKIIAPETHPKLVFKKYYFLPVEIEQAECRKDLTRLRLLVYQIFSEIKDMKYQIGFDQYLLFLAMLIFIQYDGNPPQKIDNNYVYRVIPQTIFKLKNYTEQQWIQKCHPHINRLKEEIKKIVDYNKEQLKNKKIKADSISKTALHFGPRHLCSQIVINKIKSNPIFGSNLFYVQPYKETFQKLGKKMAFNMWLAIKVEGLNLLTPSSKEIVLEVKYKDIEKIYVYSQAIIFKLEDIGTCEYRFNTYQSFEISQLVKYNKCLNETLQELEKGDEDLISRARNYKQESLIYRNIQTEKDSQIRG